MGDDAGVSSKMNGFSKGELDAFHYGLNLADYIAAITNEWGLAQRKKEKEIHTIVGREFVADLKTMLESELRIKITWESFPDGYTGIATPEFYRVVHIVAA